MASPEVSLEQTPAVPTRPTTAHSAQMAQAVVQQPQATQPQPFAIPTTTPGPQTLREKLDAGDAHWEWKIGMRAVLVLIGLIGIGCAAWTTAHFGPEKNPYQYQLDDAYSMPFTMITFGISVIWSFACIVVFFLRRRNAPVHPGAQVGMDLVLWLAFIPTAMCAVLAVASVASLGSNGRIGGGWYSSSSDGYYLYSESNSTWTWHGPNAGSRDCARNTTNPYGYTYGPVFSNCTEEDIYVNNLWTGKSHRFNTELTATVCQFLGMLIHFVLFVWACVDTKRRNSRKVGKDAEKLAAEIIMKMVQSGAIIPAPGPAHMRPMPGLMPPHMMHQGQIPPHMMQQIFPQQFPQQHSQQHYGHFAPQPQSHTTPIQPTVASSSNEKGSGPRFA